MTMKRFWLALCLGLGACSIPPVDPTYISDTPADAASFALAQRAVRACSDLHSPDAVQRKLTQAGFQVVAKGTASRGRERFDVVAPDADVIVHFNASNCFVGLVGMTPEQSYELAQIWVKAHQAKPNSAYGDGLSDHVVGAWRRFFEEPAAQGKAPYQHRIYIAAFKTWPYGPYDPSGSLGYAIEPFPKKPGAAVELSHHAQCNASVLDTVEGATCSGSAYRPR
ncbi:THUMP domain-containing protein [Shimia marina]|uniref:Lipoprotein n=1 Tax=Shimia marina TaxID=321267 RepID=A0A0P1ERK2_9RHOB|nr:hypothetical protein [Shimia marina]CUH52944.1 hypothetical protein SHM7688_02391 [Shimia marina]SFD90797.1 hypothetical protein SAMN04488037_103193 [Shimia marina]